MLGHLRRFGRGQPILADDLNAIIERIEAITPMSSDDVLVSITRAGTTFAIQKPKRFRVEQKKAELHPFLVYQHAPEDAGPNDPRLWRNVRVHFGTLNGCPPPGTDADVTPLDILIPANTNQYKIWLEGTFDTVTGVMIDRTIQHSASGWPGYPDQPNPGGGAIPSNVYVLIAAPTTLPDAPGPLPGGIAAFNQALNANLWAGPIIIDESCDPVTGITLRRRIAVERA